MNDDSSNENKNFKITHLCPSKRKLGGWHIPTQPAANFSQWGKGKKVKSDIKIDVKADSVANENAGLHNEVKSFGLMKHAKLACILVSTFVFSAFVGANYSNTITDVMVNADPKHLEAAMQVSPEAVAFALNAMDVGAQF